MTVTDMGPDPAFLPPAPTTPTNLPTTSEFPSSPLPKRQSVNLAAAASLYHAGEALVPLSEQTTGVGLLAREVIRIGRQSKDSKIETLGLEIAELASHVDTRIQEILGDLEDAVVV